MKDMTLMQHFSELKNRILYTALFFLIGLIVGWYVSPFVQEFLTQPLFNVWADGEFIYTGLSDGLMIRFSLSLLVALLVVMPVALFHIWAFVAPGLKSNERKLIWPILILSPVLFLIGAAFAFYVLFPFVFSFFIELNKSAPVPAVILPAATNYLTFTIGLLKVFGVAFQLPLILVLLNRIGFLPKALAFKMRRYAIVIIVAAAAVLTPPDIISQVVLALPMIGLFELSLLFMRND